MKTLNRYRAFILTAIGWLALDLISKWAVANSDCCTVQHNEGIAFGIQLPFMVQVVGAIVIMAILIHYGLTVLFKQPKNQFLNQLLLGIIIGGALGNLFNRLVQGYVIDFIVLSPIPVFNIADIGVTGGLITLAITQFSLTAHQK